MPDLVTHTAAAYFAGRPFLDRHKRILLYLGAILPDVLTRPFYILIPNLYYYTIGIHTPIFMLIVIALFAEFFEPGIRKTAFLYLLLGVLFHFALDILQKHLSTGYYWLFPFSWHSFEIGLFWPNQVIPFIPLWILGVFVMEFIIRKRYP